MKIRNMRESDLAFCVDLVNEEGWLSETEAMFRGFLQFDPEGCLIGEEDGRPVGTCVAVPYGECGFLGELIVVKDQRGRGFGRQLLEHGIDHLHKRGCSSIYLDGDAEAVPLYERLGFRHVCRSLRFLGQVPKRSHPHVRAMTSADIDRVLAIDREAFGADRGFFLEYRLRLFPNLCKTIISSEGNLGFCMGQPGHGVVSIGPWLVVEGIERPADMIESIAAETGGMKLRLGIEENPSWRMVLGPDVGLGNSERLYAIGSAAKG
jgi:predicted N-acetyltransferase YhbS